MKAPLFRLIIVNLVLLNMLLTTSCALTRSPSRTVQDFYRAVEAGKIDDAMEMLSERAVSTGGGSDKLRTALASQTQQIQQQGGIQSIEIINEKVVGQTAELQVRISYGNQTQRTVNVKLIEENNRWKIDMAK